MSRKHLGRRPPDNRAAPPVKPFGGNQNEREPPVQVPSGGMGRGSLLAEFFDRNMHSQDFRRILDKSGRSGD